MTAFAEQGSWIARLTRANLLLHGIGYLILGVSGFADPGTKLARIGMSAQTPEGLATFRVIYGGLMIAIALIFAISAIVRGMERFGLLSIVIVMAVLIITRRIGAALDGYSDGMQLVWTGIEFASLVLSAWLYRASRTELKMDD